MKIATNGCEDNNRVIHAIIIIWRRLGLREVVVVVVCHLAIHNNELFCHHTYGRRQCSRSRCTCTRIEQYLKKKVDGPAQHRTRSNFSTPVYCEVLLCRVLCCVYGAFQHNAMRLEPNSLHHPRLCAKHTRKARAYFLRSDPAHRIAKLSPCIVWFVIVL